MTRHGRSASRGDPRQLRPGLRALLAAALCLASLGGCRPREAPEAALARSKEAFLRQQIAGLEETIARAERGELTTTDQIALGLSERLATKLLGASLPQDITVADHVHLRIESAEAVINASKAAVLFHATASSIAVPDASASIDIGGLLDDFTLKDGRLRARVALAHFAVRESGMGDLAADALDGLIRDNLPAIQRAIPPVEFPVELAQTITVGGLNAGPVATTGGALPFEVAASQVLVGRKVLWILLKVKVGPWSVAPSNPAKSQEGGR